MDNYDETKYYYDYSDATGYITLSVIISLYIILHIIGAVLLCCTKRGFVLYVIVCLLCPLALLVPLFGACCSSNNKKTEKLRRAERSKTSVCFLCLVCPCIPFIWLFYVLCGRKKRYAHLEDKSNDRDCCRVIRPQTRSSDVILKSGKVDSNEGMAWYLHSYAACLNKFGLVKFNFTKDMTLREAIQRYVEEPRKDWETLLGEIQKNKYLSLLIEYLNRTKPKFYFRILPTGSIREGFGHPVPSTSILASDYDLMLVPDGIFVYDECTEREDGFPASFTAIDDPNQNPDRPEGYLWLRYEQDMDVWEDLCFQRMEITGVKQYLSQFAVIQMIEHQLGSPAFISSLNRYLNYDATHAREYEAEATHTGPALNIKIKKDVTGNQKTPCVKHLVEAEVDVLDVDFTIALSCPNFPRDGKYFFERREATDAEIYWPNEEITRKMHTLGCHVVPKPSTKQLATFQQEQKVNSYLGSSAVLEWRYSFSQAELLLADNVPEQARACYMALKATVKTHVNRKADDSGQYHKIQSYALKTIFFYEVEKKKPTYWEDEVREEFFWILLNSLCEKIAWRKCPHYWIESLDLFSILDDDDFASINESVQQIRKEPIKHIASEWLEWHRFVRENCCASCIEQGFEYNKVEEEKNSEPCCYAIQVDKCLRCRFKGTEYDPVAYEVY